MTLAGGLDEELAAAMEAEFPPGVDKRVLLGPMRTPSMAHAAWRRRVTRESPMRFALTYLGHHLRQSDTGQISFSRMHMDLCEAGEDWLIPGPLRDVWIGPREIGKTFWTLLGLPCWALAHGHVKFFLSFSYTAGQARGHLANLLEELRRNERLLYDFPELEILRGSVTGRMELAGGGAVAARGMGESTNGVRARADRPDLIVGDDLELAADRNTLKAVATSRAALLRNVLPMNTRARVVINGTVTMHGSLIHEFVDHVKGRAGAEWVRANRFRVNYYPALDDLGRSVWPQRWTAEWLRREREADDYAFALNYDNDPPVEAHQKFWTPDGFQYNQRFQVAERVLYIDPAVSPRTTSDFTVLAMVAADAGRRRALVERVEWGRWSGPETGDRIHEFCAPLRIKPTVVVESNQGGQALLDTYAPWPVGVVYDTVHSTVPKGTRIRWGHTHYTRRAVWHPWPLPDLEQELCRYPRGSHDDVPDAVAGALLHFWPHLEQS